MVAFAYIRSKKKEFKNNINSLNQEYILSDGTSLGQVGREVPSCPEEVPSDEI